MKNKNKKKKTIIPLKRDDVYKRFEHLLLFKNIIVPKEHRKNIKNPHSLRCFRMKYQRDENGEKLKDLPRVRCKNAVQEGYLYCRFHGGRKNLPVKMKDVGGKGHYVKAYKEIYDIEMKDLLVKFLNDPGLLDMKPDLANLRVILNTYIKKIMENSHPTTHSNFLNQVREIMIAEERNDKWKYDEIIKLADSQKTITNGQVIDRIYRCVDSIGKTIERIRKYETGNFMLTPEGLKLFIRSIVELMEKNIKDEEVIFKIRDGLLELSIKTQGNLGRYQEMTLDENGQSVEDAEIIE
jgi:hypothetical protein